MHGDERPELPLSADRLSLRVEDFFGGRRGERNLCLVDEAQVPPSGVERGVEGGRW